MKCWVKEHLPITNTAGAAFVKKLKYLQGHFLSREIRKNIYIFPLPIQTKYDGSGNKTTCYNFQPSFVDKLYPFTATSSVCIRLADFLEISVNKSE